MADPRRIYRLLLKLYPARFREEYAEPLERQFWDEYREAQGPRALFWLRALQDLAISIPTEILRELRQDLRYAARVYRKRSLVTVLALTALALGIGATTGVFSVLNALLLRSLPFREPERLVEVQAPPVNVLAGRSAFYRWRDDSAYAGSIATYSQHEMTLGLMNESVRVKVAETSANFLVTLGSDPVLGRGFAADEDVKGRDGVAVIGHGLWQELFGGDPRVLGKTINLNGTPLVVIGVAPPDFDYPARTVVWAPTVFDMEKISNPGVTLWQTVARLKPGIALARARSTFHAEVARLRPELLERRTIAGFSTPVPMLNPLRDQLAGPVRQASWVLMAVVVFVLLIACANVAHLLLSRFAERRQELAIRAALGASRARLVQQLVTESVLLTLVAATAGLGVARWASRLAALAQPAQLAAQDYTILDWRVLGFAVGVAALTGIVFGVLPAFLMGRMQPSADPICRQTGARTSAVNRVRATLITMQAAFTLVLVAGSLLMGRTFLRLLGTDLGFRTDQVVTLNVSLAGTRYEANHTATEYYHQALARLRSVAGVESAAGVPYLPLMNNFYMAQAFRLDAARKAVARTISATPDYFRTLRTPLLEGREFTAADRAKSEPVVIVNDAFQELIGAGPLTGKRVSNWRGDRQYTIVGVVKTARMGPTVGRRAEVFLPVDQSPPQFITFIARVRGNPESYLAMCRDVVRQVDPQIPVYDVKTLDQRLADNLAQPRIYTIAILFFGGFALLLALIGIYGVASYSITQRTHEIGVRIAVGAAPADVRFMLLRQSMLPLLGGLLLGIGGAMALGRSLEQLIATAPPVDVATCALASVVLSAGAGVAVWTATRRILRMDPTNALRVD